MHGSYLLTYHSAIRQDSAGPKNKISLCNRSKDRIGFSGYTQLLISSKGEAQVSVRAYCAVPDVAYAQWGLALPAHTKPPLTSNHLTFFSRTVAIKNFSRKTLAGSIGMPERRDCEHSGIWSSPMNDPITSTLITCVRTTTIFTPHRHPEIKVVTESFQLYTAKFYNAIFPLFACGLSWAATATRREAIFEL